MLCNKLFVVPEKEYSSWSLLAVICMFAVGCEEERKRERERKTTVHLFRDNTKNTKFCRMKLVSLFPRSIARSSTKEPSRFPSTPTRFLSVCFLLSAFSA